MSLNVPADQAPEHVCVVSQYRVCPRDSEDSEGNLIEARCKTRDLSDLQLAGSLPDDLATEDVVITAPQRATVERVTVDSRNQRSSEIVDLKLAPELWNALNDLTRDKHGYCHERHAGCTPRVSLMKFAKSGRIVCGRDPNNHNKRVAIVELSYHASEPASGVQEVELQGTTATLSLQRELPATSGAHSVVLGGDYIFSPIASDGTNEHISITLQPRCTLFGALLPLHSATIPLHEASMHLDTWRQVSHAVDSGSRPLTEGSDTSDVRWHCTPKLQQNTLPINIPYTTDPGIKHLVVSTAPERSNNMQSSIKAMSSTTVLEATWDNALPQNPFKMGVTYFEFTWNRNCLTGYWPLPPNHSNDDNLEDICPRVTVDEFLRCSIVGQPDLSTCSYRCMTDPGNPLILPISVRFDRIVHYEKQQEQMLYSWHDTLTYPGQRLSSVVEAHERKVIVDICPLCGWVSRPGNEIERIEISPDSSDRSQVISIGNVATTRTAIAAPNAICMSRFAIDGIGTRFFARRDQHVASSGNLVLTNPIGYQNRFHPTLSIGVGFLFPQNEPLTKPRGEPHASIGAGIEMYYEGWLLSALELGVVYEPGFSAYGTIPHPQTRDQDKTNVPYHRLMFELAGAHWGTDRTWEVGIRTGGGAGGPIFGRDAEKVGGFHKFMFGGLLGRVHFYPASLHAAIQLDWGIKWGEDREYFGTDAAGDADPSRFRGNSAVAELSLVEMYAGLRWRLSFR